jgi:hypothetical protein
MRAPVSTSLRHGPKRRKPSNLSRASVHRHEDCSADRCSQKRRQQEIPILPTHLTYGLRSRRHPLRKRASRGFATMNPTRRRELRVAGARPRTRRGLPTRFTTDEARVAGRTGGHAAHRAKRPREPISGCRHLVVRAHAALTRQRTGSAARLASRPLVLSVPLRRSGTGVICSMSRMPNRTTTRGLE